MKSDFRNDLFKGKVILVTGGATGIGFGICTQFGLHGAKIAMGGRRTAVLENSCKALQSKGIQAVGFQCDVRDPAACINLVEKTIESYGRLDVLVNNAAGNFSVSAENLTSNGFKTVMDIDLHGSFNMAKAALPYLKVSGKGVIIHISATLQYKAFPFQMHASAAKAGIDVMTNNLGVEWGTDYGIRTVSIAPGPIENTVGGPGGRVFGTMAKMTGIEDKRLFVPLNRYGTVEDIANAAMFIASDAGGYINATQLVVDGGQYHEASGRYLMMKKIMEDASNREKTMHKKSKL
uniref:2,4-dienoyl-CoA reductase [(3E)-enoyl-CoA-producing] n=1 Tax=Mucochytrium quahogii TaxID=96639 RepID=A0A7S2SGD4_9STRA|mmetsp:Transcript_19440/g.31988  ORF Transcript_19440/g.31988 Transcript_19440/m.31988 type:complete len:292 (+) Transcript_19440:481-1356(+)